jgi:hypothetical protein
MGGMTEAERGPQGNDTVFMADGSRIDIYGAVAVGTALRPSTRAAPRTDPSGRF